MNTLTEYIIAGTFALEGLLVLLWVLGYLFKETWRWLDENDHPEKYKHWWCLFEKSELTKEWYVLKDYDRYYHNLKGDNYYGARCNVVKNCVGTKKEIEALRSKLGRGAIEKWTGDAPNRPLLQTQNIILQYSTASVGIVGIVSLLFLHLPVLTLTVAGSVGSMFLLRQIIRIAKKVKKVTTALNEHVDDKELHNTNNKEDK